MTSVSRVVPFSALLDHRCCRNVTRHASRSPDIIVRPRPVVLSFGDNPSSRSSVRSTSPGPNPELLGQCITLNPSLDQNDEASASTR
jgi:hypothetical protein